MEIQKLYTHLEQNREKYIQELMKFCAQPSVAAENRGMEEMANIVQEKLQSIGAEVQRVVVDGSHPYLLGELKAPNNPETKKTVLIYDHYDVQPEEPVEEWKTPPFEPTVIEDILYCRGSSDNKANLVFRIQVIEAMLEVWGDLPVNIKFLIEGEEEIGSPHLPALQKQYGDFWKDSDVCIWETGSVDENDVMFLKLGMKGVLYVELSCQFNKGDIHSGEAAIIDSPVWRLVSALSTIRNPEGKVTIDDFYENALQPTPMELDLMENMNFDPQSHKDVEGAEKTLAPVDDKKAFLKQMYFTATANIAGIWGGYTKPGGVKTILPNAATAKVDFRLIPNQSPSEILQKLRKHLDKRGFTDIEIKEYVSLECGKSKIENEYIQKCITVFRDHFNKEPNVTITALGSGPIYPIASVYDIPVVQIGAEYPGCKAHAPNENIRLKDYYKAMEVFAQYLFELSQQS